MSACLVPRLAFGEGQQQIAAHGGYAELVAVEAPVAYLRMGGGCQGCGMAHVTLKRGIEARIREAVPEVTGVVDSTDHAGGANPYFRAAESRESPYA